MSESYTKLSSTLVHSTVWRESAETRVVWITLLALADQHGEVHASIPGLADAARVTTEQCEEALALFRAPDPYSRTKTLEGRKITALPGGWYIVNYDLYRGLLSLDHRRALARDRQARHRAKKRNDVTRDITPSNSRSRQAEAEAKADASTTKDLRASVVYARYLELFPDSRLSFPSASRAIKRAPKQFSAEELVEAIEGNAADPWHAERGKHELSYVLRNEEKIDQFREMRRRQIHPKLMGVGGDLTSDELAQLGIRL